MYVNRKCPLAPQWRLEHSPGAADDRAHVARVRDDDMKGDSPAGNGRGEVAGPTKSEKAFAAKCDVARKCDEPPPEVAAAGHDRCITPIGAENLDAWLNPEPEKLDAPYAILDERERPYYEHRLAA